MTAPAPIERVAVAAVLHVADPGCAMALAELEDAVAELSAEALEPGSALAVALRIAARSPSADAPPARAVEGGR